MNLNKNAEQEVIDFHQALQGWLGGTTANTDKAYAPIENALAANFTYTLPDGVSVDKAATVGELRRAYGAHGQDFRIWIQAFRVIASTDTICVVDYEEWQRIADGSITGRSSTAVFSSNDNKRRQVEWLHVHETWLAAEVVGNFVIPGA
jgi:hypothetical protein